MFGHKFFGGTDADATVVANPIEEASPMNDTATAAAISFPTPWPSRIQTPIKRPPLGSMWGNEPMESYGGPWG